MQWKKMLWNMKNMIMITIKHLKMHQISALHNPLGVDILLIWSSLFVYLNCSVGWGCRIHWLHLCRGVRPPSPNEYPGHDTKQSDGEVQVMHGIWSTPSLSLLPGPLWPEVVAPDRALSVG